MLSVGTCLLAMAAAAAPVGGGPRLDAAPSIHTEVVCDAGAAPDAGSSAERAPSAAEANRSCADGDGRECLLEPSSPEPPAARYGEGFCDADDAGECLIEPVHEPRPAPAVILSCEDPYVAAMIGSCDLPHADSPGRPSRFATLHSGAATRVALVSTSHGGSVLIVSPAPSMDTALTAVAHVWAVYPPASPLFVLLPRPAVAPPPPRLDRPPRV